MRSGEDGRYAIDSKLTSVGKDERAISVSGYVYRGDVKITQRAYDKVIGYKGTSRNHLIGQVIGFRVGDKDGSRGDDLLDCFCYGVAIAQGNPEGFDLVGACPGAPPHQGKPRTPREDRLFF